MLREFFFQIFHQFIGNMKNNKNSIILKILKRGKLNEVKISNFTRLVHRLNEQIAAGIETKMI